MIAYGWGIVHLVYGYDKNLKSVAGQEDSGDWIQVRQWV
jgi:hypothetical protein